MVLKRRLALALVAVFSVTPLGARAQDAAPSFAATAQAFVDESERRDPLFADQIGIHTYDDTLDDYSAAGHRARLAWLRAWRARIAAQTAGLPAGDDADAHALLDTIDLELFEDATLAPWHNDPTGYEGTIGNAVYALTGRHYAPLDERLRHVASRLVLVPGIVAAAKANLLRPTRTATLQAIDENAGNVALYEGLPALAKSAAPQTQRKIASALPAALASIRSLGTYLRVTVLPRSDRNPRVGATVYDRELALADGTAQTRAELIADAQADFQRNRVEMLRLAIPFDRRFFPERVADETRSNAADIVVRRVLDKLANDHPDRTAIFRTAKNDVEESQAFLKAHPVVTLPQPSTLHVVPTPGFMAGFAGASLDPAGPFTPLAESFYYIDNIPKTWKPARVASYLRDYNDYEMRILSMHEAVPGHYVQFRYNSQVPSLVRRVFANGAFAEGWAVYIEGMMLDAGYGDNDPRLRLFQLKWRLREEANTLIDAAFHTGDLTQARCNDLLERQAYQERSEALTKWHRLQLSHVQLTSYFVGLDAIRRAEAAQRAKLGSAFDVAKFNSALLAMGSVEPRYIETLLDASTAGS
ncbi:MAG: DUF885 domain-containing protein [Vulcanimicrobiaceae bacterium]